MYQCVHCKLRDKVACSWPGYSAEGQARGVRSEDPAPVDPDTQVHLSQRLKKQGNSKSYQNLM
jgi:hypothetical protein